jgi:hypothetical protein
MATNAATSDNDMRARLKITVDEHMCMSSRSAQIGSSWFLEVNGRALAVEELPSDLGCGSLLPKFFHTQPRGDSAQKQEAIHGALIRPEHLVPGARGH